MNTFLIVLKYICLLLAIVYTFVNVVKAFRGLDITSGAVWLMATSIVGYVVLEFGPWS